MHFHVEVYLAKEPRKDQDLEQLMMNILEQYNDDNGGWWDWFQVGGRWRGVHDPTYDHKKDASLKKPCEYCGSTGRRKKPPEIGPGGKDGIVCNACDGTGTAEKWPTEWDVHPKDIIAAKDLADGFSCYRLVLPDEVLEAPYDYDAKDKRFANVEFAGEVKPALKKRGLMTGYLVTVDCHD